MSSSALFIIGNKRSGSTHLMRMLNLHPDIFVSNESDIVWILYCLHHQRPITDYPYDSPAGKNRAMQIAGNTLNPHARVQDNFVNFQMQFMRGFHTEKQIPANGSFTYIGDQKPYQNCDPELLPFVLENFPKSKFIHLVRHPYEVISSAKNFDHGSGGFLWQGKSDEEIMAQWCLHENWVNAAIEKHQIELFRIYYHDIIAKPKEAFTALFKWLSLESSPQLLHEINNQTKVSHKALHNYKPSPQARILMAKHGFKIHFNAIERHLLPLLRKIKSQLI
ncbi:hypothetical protein GC194_00295 [bacterium]|nr:hypothetical protein [bacterium]